MFETLVAFGAGLISFLSPCVLPLIPGYISYISGSTFNELIEKKYLIFTLSIWCMGDSTTCMSWSQWMNA